MPRKRHCKFPNCDSPAKASAFYCAAHPRGKPREPTPIRGGADSPPSPPIAIPATGESISDLELARLVLRRLALTAEKDATRQQAASTLSRVALDLMKQGDGGGDDPMQINRAIMQAEAERLGKEWP
ncbi:MAG: hypothetical protein OXE50_02225 [Chloroflexi bacterium]|nr:hypothetical protein [Chloroflexota bacterium]